MWSCGIRFLCCGKSNRQRCVPLTPLIQSSCPAAGCAWASSAPLVTPKAAAAPARRVRKPRRCVFAVRSIGDSFEKRYTNILRVMRFAPEYVTCVLNENFEDAKAQLLAPMMAINYAHLVMLAAQGIVSATEAHALREALDSVSQDHVRDVK